MMQWIAAVTVTAKPFVGMLGVALSVAVAYGEDRHWVNVDGGTFAEPANWTDSMPPGEADSAVFDLEGEAFEVDFDAGASHHRLLFRNAEVTFDLRGATYQLTNPATAPGATDDVSIIIGSAGGDDGSLTLTGAGVLAGVQGRVGNAAGSRGRMHITEGVALSLSNVLHVGHAGSGELLVDAGSGVSSVGGNLGTLGGSLGEVTVAGEGATWDNDGFMGIGIGGEGRLTVADGAQVSNTPGYIAMTGGAQGAVEVMGTGSTWANDGELFIGFGGTGELHVGDGGTVTNKQGSVGRSVGSSGRVMVVGTDSSWTSAGSLLVGHAGSGELDIQDGGRVVSNQVYLALEAGSHGVARVTGAGSTWNNTGSLRVGGHGSAELTIGTGAMVTNADGHVGRSAGSDGRVTVEGEGATWVSAGRLVIGDAGTGDLAVLEGGTVTSAEGVIGSADGASGTVVVAGSGSTWVSEGSLSAGGAGEGTLTITDGGRVTSGSGGIGVSAGATGVVSVTGDSSVWVSEGNLTVGDHGHGEMTVAAGGGVTTTHGRAVIGGGSLGGDGSGTVLVTGAGSHWTNTGDLSVGRFGSGELRINDGGSVSNAEAVIGEVAGSTGLVLVGKDASWQNAGELLVGDRGAGELRIEAGGTVASTMGYVGQSTGEGLAILTGAGSTWTATQNLHVGGQGVGELRIEAGAVVSNHSGYIGRSEGGHGTVIVTGEGSTWTNTGELYVADRDGYGELTIADGATVRNRIVYIGGGKATVTGVGTTWDSSRALALWIGELMVDSGASVLSERGLIGSSWDPMAEVTQVTISGVGSSWTIADDLIVSQQSEAVLRIEDGAHVSSGTGEIGRRDHNGFGGTVVVTGSGSTWTNAGELLIGAGRRDYRTDSGRGTLHILAGGTVSNTVGYIGHMNRSRGDVSVSGQGSQWINTEGLFIGYQTEGHLEVAAGGLISTAGQSIVSESTVTVRGAESAWITDGALHVSDSTMTLMAGATVSNADALVGTDTPWRYGQRRNRQASIVVDGGGTKWINTGSLTIGDTAPGEMRVEAGGRVESQNSTLGRSALGEVVIEGAGSIWATDSRLYIGESAAAELAVESGGQLLTGGLTYIAVDPEAEGTVTLHGADTRWISDGPISVGYRGTGEISVASGAAVQGTSSIVGHEAGATGSVLVTGAGSQWANTNSLSVGQNGFGQLVVEAGGSLSNVWGQIGYGVGGEGQVVVAGQGSSWTSDLSLVIGDGGTGTMTVRDGGTAQSAIGVVGQMAGAEGQLTVTGQGSTWTGGMLSIGESGDGAMLVEQGGSVMTHRAMLGHGPAATGTVTVAGAQTSWSTANKLTVGVFGNGELHLIDGASLSAETSVLGQAGGSHGRVLVGGAGSIWSNGELVIGQGGQGELEIVDGGEVATTWTAVGAEVAGQGLVTVGGEGAAWRNDAELTVGRFGQGTVEIGPGGTALTQKGVVGYGSGSAGEVHVDGAEAAWEVDERLILGQRGSGEMHIRGGGQAWSGRAELGVEEDGRGLAVVTGPGSAWTNTGMLVVGGVGIADLRIEDGGAVSAGDVALGQRLHTYDYSTAIVAGSGSSLTVEGGIQLGDGGRARLSIHDGGSVWSEVGYVGHWSGDRRGRGDVEVIGADATWNNSGHLYVGYAGTGFMTITDGGSVLNADATVGDQVSGYVTVSGAGSTWLSEGDLTVARAASIGRLTIEQQGLVVSESALIAFESDSEGIVTVTGQGSRWQVSDELVVSDRGTARLVIEDGGLVESGRSTIGGDFGTDGRVTVTGAESTWAIADELHVSSRLMVLDGGLVTSGTGYIQPRNDSQARVDGEGSRWVSTGSLYLGGDGTTSTMGGTLTVANGGRVEVADTLFIAERGRLVLDGGVVRLSGFEAIEGATLDYQSGAVELVGDRTVGSDAGIAAFFGEPPVISHGQSMLIDGLATVETSLSVTGGQLTTNGAVIRHVDASQAQVRVAGTDSRWINHGWLDVGGTALGSHGYGTLRVEDDGLVDAGQGLAIGSGGTVVVDGGTLRLDGYERQGTFQFVGGGIELTGDRVIGQDTVIHDIFGTPPAIAAGQTLAIEGEAMVESDLTIDGGSLTSLAGHIGFSDGDHGTTIVTGANGRWTIGHTLNVGHSGTGELTIADGGMVSGWNHVIGREAGSMGVVTVNGEGSTWATSGGALDVGRYGDGTLTIEAGGTVSNANGWIGAHGGQGEVLVTGPGSTWTSDGTLTVGSHNQGTLTVADGGAVTSHEAILGEAEGSTGEATVTGPGSAWTIDEKLFVGNHGQGELLIEDGGQVVNHATGVIAAEEDGVGDVTVTGSDALWQTGGWLRIGYKGQGTLTIADGGTVTSEESMAGDTAGSEGVVTVTGEGSTWATQGRLTIGRYSNGTLTVAEGGVVSNGEDGVVGSWAGSIGEATITGEGSAWHSDESFIVGRDSTGELTIENGGAVTSAKGILGVSFTGDGTVTVTGSGSIWEATSLNVGDEGTGSLKILSGGAVHTSETSRIGVNAGGDGSVTVQGSGSTWTSTSGLSVGQGGRGSLSIGDGGTVDIAGMSIGGAVEGVVDVSGQGSTLMNSANLGVGRYGTGSLTVEDGATVSNHIAQIGEAPNGHGAVAVTGEGSLWESSGWLIVGNYGGMGSLIVEDEGRVGVGEYIIAGWRDGGHGSIVVRDGGSLTSDRATLGRERGTYGEILVTGEGSSYTYDQWIRVGYNAFGGFEGSEGHVVVSDGATMAGHEAAIAVYRNSTGSVTVSGEGSSWTNTGTLYVGGGEDLDSSFRWTTGGGQGLLLIEDGASVSNADAYVGAYGSFFSLSEGVVDVRGENSTWLNTGSVYLGIEFGSSDGHLTVADGGKVIAQGVDGLTLRESGTLAGDSGTVEADVTSDGLVRPGSDTATGLLTIDGDYTQSELGTLAIALAGSEAGDVSQLLVTGHANLAGTLDLTLLDGFTPSYGDSFDVIHFDSLSGAFDEVLGTDLGGLYFDVVEHGDRLTLETLASPGNMNLDGQIDFDDISAFMLALNDPAAYEAQHGLDPTLVGDINGDGRLDFDDINPFVALLESGTATVPEPGTLAMLGVGGLALLRRQRVA